MTTKLVKIGPILLGLSLLALTAVFVRFGPLDPLSISAIDPNQLTTGEYDSADTKGTFHGQSAYSSLVASVKPITPVLGINNSQKRIEVDLTNQRLYAFEGDTKVYDFLISSGLWGRTPTGTFTFWGKFRYTKMSGGSRALRTYYYLPNVPYVMFFSNDQIAASRGFSLHGTYWHSNFGHPMSHGCINMRTEEAEKIFYWSQPTVGEANYTKVSADNPGTQVIIYGVAPRE